MCRPLAFTLYKAFRKTERRLYFLHDSRSWLILLTDLISLPDCLHFLKYSAIYVL